MMEKVGLEDFLDVGGVMLGRSLAIMQHFRRAVRDHSGLQSKNADLERQVQQLLKERSDKDSAFTAKELQLLHLQQLCKCHEVELICRQGELVCAEGALKEVESRMVDFEKEVAKMGHKESEWKKWEEELARKEAEWDEEKLQLQRGCVDAYEEGFMKAMRQAILFSLELDPTRFDINKEVADG